MGLTDKRVALPMPFVYSFGGAKLETSHDILQSNKKYRGATIATIGVHCYDFTCWLFLLTSSAMLSLSES